MLHQLCGLCDAEFLVHAASSAVLIDIAMLALVKRLRAPIASIRWRSKTNGVVS